MDAGPRELERIRRLYNRRPERYERCMGLTDRLTRGARREVGEAARGEVLEVGIGTGLSLPWYGPGVRSLVGVDLAAGMLGRARARAADAGFPARLLEMDAQALAFPDASFDTVVFSLCLCTIPDPARALREAVRVARPGAAVLLLEHVRSNLAPVALIQDLLTPLTRALEADHLNRRTGEVARACGLEVESERRWALGALTLIRARTPLDPANTRSL